jgi:Na+/H+ antiporter NhaD/arsenite permease-like protein
MRRRLAPLFALVALATPSLALASASASAGPTLAGIPVAFLLFATTLLGVALFHHHTLAVALTGLGVITAFQVGTTDLDLLAHLAHEGVTLINLLGLLLGFGLLADHFERSHVPELLPRFLPDGWKGAFALLWLVFVISSFLDNIAAAMIGATVANAVFRGRVHIGYLAAIIAASNAGGAGSVVGDTTTTMMWIAGVAPLSVTKAFLGSTVATVISGLIASRQQDAHQPLVRDGAHEVEVDRARVGVVAFLLLAAMGTNVLINTAFPDLADRAPWLAIALWAAIGVTHPLRPATWSLLPDALRGAVFLLSLVLCASMMPVSELPAASWQTAMGLGYVSAVFDNIPLTALALHQGGYDWGVLAMAVGYGGSMVWFGSSAGVAVSNAFPEARNTLAYLRQGWHVALAYTVGFLFLVAVAGWAPETGSP